MALNPLAQQTLDRAHATLRSGKAVALPEIVKLIQTLSTHAHEVEVNELVELVQKDPAVLTRVLASAQSLAYNISRTPVTSVAQAIHLIGYARIRTLTMSILIAESAGARRSEEHRQAAAAAICAGFIAESAAQLYSFCDREEAFVGACLRNLGQVVLAATAPAEQAQIAALPAGEQDAAARRLVGLTPLELGRELLRGEKMPDAVLQAMADFRPEAGNVRGTDLQMVALCDLATRLAQTATAPDPGDGSGPRAMRTLAARYQASFPGLEESFGEMMGSARRQLQQFIVDRRALGLSSPGINRFVRLATALEPKLGKPAEAGRTPAAEPAAPPPPVPVEVAPAVPALAEPGPAESGPPAEPAESGEWRERTQRLTELTQARSVPVPEVLSDALEIFRQGCHAPDALLFRAQGWGDALQLAGGSGLFFQSLPRVIRVQAADRTVLGVCLRYRENVLIHDAGDAKIAPHLPEWLAGPSAPQAFALFPLLAPAGPCGLLLVAWPSARQLRLPEDAMKRFAEALTILGRYCERVRG